MFVKITFNKVALLRFQTSVKSFFDIQCKIGFFFSENRDVTKMILARKWNLGMTSIMQQKSRIQDISKGSDH